MAHIGTLLQTMLFGKLVGTDSFGNRYYQSRSRLTSHGHKKRWVVYKGIVEPSKVPAEWHGWLHYTTSVLPAETQAKPHAWQKEHLPNLTGTQAAYVPAGHVTRGGKHAPTVADYEAWKP